MRVSTTLTHGLTEIRADEVWIVDMESSCNLKQSI